MFINRLAEISENYDVFIIPYYGAISDGLEPYPFSIPVLSKLREIGKKIFILENTAARVSIIQQELEKAGISGSLYDGILTSGEISYHELAKKISPMFKNLGTCYYHIGRDFYRENWVDIGYIPVTDLNEADFVLVSSSENKQDMIEKYLPVLRDAATIGLPLLCVDPNKNLLLPNTDEVGAGSIAARYEAMGGIVLSRGKPQTDILQYCLEAVPEIDKTRAIIIANSYMYDIKGAVDMGIDSLLVCDGTHGRELGIFLRKDISWQIVEELSRHYGYAPTYAISQLKY